MIFIINWNRLFTTPQLFRGGINHFPTLVTSFLEFVGCFNSVFEVIPVWVVFRSPTSKKGSLYPTTGRNDVSCVSSRQGNTPTWRMMSQMKPWRTDKMFHETKKVFICSNGHLFYICSNFKNMNQEPKSGYISWLTILSLLKNPKKPAFILLPWQKLQDFPPKTRLFACFLRLVLICTSLQGQSKLLALPQGRNTALALLKGIQKKKHGKELKSLVIYCIRYTYRLKRKTVGFTFLRFSEIMDSIMPLWWNKHHIILPQCVRPGFLCTSAPLVCQSYPPHGTFGGDRSVWIIPENRLGQLNTTVFHCQLPYQFVGLLLSIRS